MLFNINISMEYYISRYTLAKLENSIQNYKRRILMDFYKINNLDISYKDFENQFLGETPRNNNLKKYDENRCHAFVWDKDKKQKRQCFMSKQCDNFCKKHRKDQNYGIIKI